MGECYLTASFFETGKMTTPTKLQNPTILGLGVPASTNGHTLAGFCHWYPSFADNGYLHLRALEE